MSWVEIATAGGSATIVLTALGGLGLRSLKAAVRHEVAAHLEPMKEDLNELKLKFAAETGGNSNGLRQKVNEMDQKLDSNSEAVAYLKGALQRGLENRA